MLDTTPTAVKGALAISQRPCAGLIQAFRDLVRRQPDVLGDRTPELTDGSKDYLTVTGPSHLSGVSVRE